MKCVRTIALAIVLSAACAAPARADATAFLGANLSPANRQVNGVSAGVSLVIVGLSSSMRNATDDQGGRARRSRPGWATCCCRRRSPSPASSRTSPSAAACITKPGTRIATPAFGMNTGGGVKISLVGPIRLRVDYRVFKLGSGALNTPAHRIYAGLNLKF